MGASKILMRVSGVLQTSHVLLETWWQMKKA
jgi:hypothetical protein